MPIYNPNHLEYGVTNSYIHVSLDSGDTYPAYWAYPQFGGKYPAVVVLHDWWGITAVVRRLADMLAQQGRFVIVPDLFDGQTATTPKEAIALVESLGESNGMQRIAAAIDVVERHHQTNTTTAVIGLGMGGSFAFDVAINRDDLEAVVAFSGFPQRNLGRFQVCKIPILAFYGSNEPHIPPPTIERLRRELAQSPAAQQHQVKIVEGIAHEFFNEAFDEPTKEISRKALKEAIAFIEQYLKMPAHRQPPKTY